MNSQFFKNPILNSPYKYPDCHWELDDDGQPTRTVIERRRRAEFISPIPKPKKRGGKSEQQRLVFDEGKGLSTREQQYAQHAEIINSVRREVDEWRRQPDPNRWRVTPETQRLLQHWRHHRFGHIRPFFCQVEAVETVIWLTEVAPQVRNTGRRFLQYLDDASQEANPGLRRFALKLATGAGKTMVMAMLIAWQTINSVRRPQSSRFTRGFLIVTPGVTIKDRLRVLKSNDPDSYYRDRELVPVDLLPALDRAKIVVTNYHALRRRERIEIAKGGRALLQGRGLPLDTRESEGQMLQRVMPELMGMKNILVLNDEAHHCYREKPGEGDEGDLKGDEKKEAEKNREAARLWISGIEAVSRKLGTSRVVDLSATPFFLSGSGYAEGTLFPWTMCDFSLMDAIECGIVKLPRVPVADNVPGNEMPMYRELWKHIRTRMPKQGRGKAGALNPLSLPPQLRTALDALYGHYEQTFRLWEKAGISVPPCFIVVCNNTAASKLVYDYISGFYRQKEDGSRMLENGRLELFRNFDNDGNPLGRPRTLLIGSEQLESGDALDSSFRKMAATEIERFRREIIERTGDRRQAENIREEELLREVMNTVGKPGRLGDSIRCVVSVSMLSEGWDANTVTHVLGVRAFGTQLAYKTIADIACERIAAGITRSQLSQSRPAKVILDPYNPTGSTAHVNFRTSKTSRYQTEARRCHVNWAILDSDWEAELCRVVEAHPRVKAYVKNRNLDFEVPYTMGSETRKYVPDFIVLVRDRSYDRDFLHLVVEIKGYRGEDAKHKRETMETCWIPGVNRLGTHGRWAFAELTDVYTVGADFADRVKREVRGLIEQALPAAEIEAARRLAEAGGSMPDLEYIPRRKSVIWE